MLFIDTTHEKINIFREKDAHVVFVNKFTITCIGVV